MKYFTFAVALLLAGCATSAEDLIKAVQLEDGEIGSVCLRANLDTNPNPFVTALVSFVYREKSGDDIPDPDC